MQMVRKVIYGKVDKNFTKTPDGSLLTTGYFTSDKQDEVGDIITREATDRALPKYREWGNIRLMHLPKPVGKVTRIGTTDGLDWNEVEFEVIDPEAVFMVERGLLTALSVGILINFDDIEIDRDGGWVIHDYQLAEISLVDHPANYDAKLKTVPQTEALREFAREYGMEAVAKGLDAFVGQENKMGKDKELDQEVEPKAEDIIEEKDLETSDEMVSEPTDEVVEETKELDESVEEDVQEDKDAEADIEKDVEPEMEKEIVSEDKMTETDEEVIPESDEVKELEPESEVADEVVEEKEIESIDGLSKVLENLVQITANLVTLTNSLQSQKAETAVEAPVQEQADSKQEADKDLEDEDELEKLGPVANRKGAVQETNLPTKEEVDEQEDINKNMQPGNLREALLDKFKVAR